MAAIAAYDSMTQPVDATGGTASIAGLTVTQERRILIQQRAAQRDSHNPHSRMYDPWALHINQNGLKTSAAQMMYAFKRGQSRKTSQNTRKKTNSIV